jgi:HPt (histidine-containing phosphotransfer) domain-containing protein
MGRDTGLRMEEENVSEEILPLVGGFLQRRSAEIPLLRESVGKSDFDSVRMIGHKLKGNCAGFGFPAMGVLGAGLESAAMAKDPEVALRLVDDLELMVRRLQQNLA